MATGKPGGRLCLAPLPRTTPLPWQSRKPLHLGAIEQYLTPDPLARQSAPAPIACNEARADSQLRRNLPGGQHVFHIRFGHNAPRKRVGYTPNIPALGYFARKG